MTSGLEEIGIRDDEEPTILFIPPISTRSRMKEKIIAEARADDVDDVDDGEDDETIVHGLISEVIRDVDAGAGANEDVSITASDNVEATLGERADAEVVTAKARALSDEHASAGVITANERAPADDHAMLLHALSPDAAKELNTRRTSPVILLEAQVSEPGVASASEGAGLLEWLARIPLFRGMDTRYIERIARLGALEHHPVGAYIFRHGDHGEDLFIVLEGALQVLRTIEEVGDEALALLRPGHHFGEMSFLDSGATRSADLLVQRDARLLRLPMRPLRDLMFVDRDLAHDLLWRFVHDLTRRVRHSNDRLSMLTTSQRFS
jgi:hypothetical protein